MQFRIWRPELRFNLIMWGIALVILVGLAVLLAWVSATMGAGGEGNWLIFLAIVAIVVIIGVSGRRKGEFSPTIVTVDDAGIAVETRPVAHSWRLAWHEIGRAGVVRDARDRAYVVLEPADGRERGTRSALERRLAGGFSLPVHARSLQLPDDLRAALDARLPGGLGGYPMR